MFLRNVISKEIFFNRLKIKFYSSAFNGCTNGDLVSKLIMEFLYLADIKYLLIRSNGYKISISIGPFLNFIPISIESKCLHYHGLSLLLPLGVDLTECLCLFSYYLFGSCFSANRLLQKENSIKFALTIFISLNVKDIMPMHSEYSVFSGFISNVC